MKQRRVERVERRRPSVELNLSGDAKALPKTPRGLVALLKRVLLGQR